MTLDFPNFKDYSFPNIECLQGSAWHDWSKCGAIYAFENPNVNIDFASVTFALQSTFYNSVMYNSMLKAFLQGARNVNHLTKIKRN